MKSIILEMNDSLTNSEGIYEIVGFYEKGGTVVTVKERVYEDDSDKYTLQDDEIYFTEEEVVDCLKFEYGVNCKFDIKMGE